jgi:CDP-glycerol glycerophosphotransferase
MAEWITPKPGQIFIQCWHGTPLKRLGYDVTIKTKAALNTAEELAWRFGLDAAKWSYLLSPSPFTSESLASAFGLQSLAQRPRIIEEGYPRNDSIVRTLSSPERDVAIERIKQKLGIPEDKHVLLYAPTWRDSIYTASAGYGSGEMPDFAAIRNALSDQWVILLRSHYHVKSWNDAGAAGLINEAEAPDASDVLGAAKDNFLIDVSDVSDINELYLVADTLLTDYSSVLFDYANTGRPTIYYWPDLEEYREDIRGFYFDPATLPGDKCMATAEVISALNALGTWRKRYGVAYRAFRERFCPKDDGYTAERVVAEIFLEMGEIEE